MLKKIVLVAGAVFGIGIFFLLPKSLVNTKNREVSVNDPSASGKHDEELQHLMESSHSAKPTESDTKKLSDWTNQLGQVVDKEKKRIFADSIAGYYQRFHQFDSVAKYRELAAQWAPSSTRYVLAADAYMQAADFTDDLKRTQYQEQSRVLYNKALEGNPNDPDIRSKLALTYVASDSPMKGIKILQEVVKEYPENETALYNLGYLSIQSGQYPKALDRFEKLTQVNPKHAAGTFYLGFCYSQIGNKDKAKECYERAKKLDLDPEFQEIIDSYIKEIN
jgi:tetratricopeptide (TPR) repeat protein